jgi:glycosyltransferase involved in cell wall biosynthesis
VTHTVFIEVGPLQEIRYAGISNVTLNLCRYWLQQPSEACRFFLGPYLIERGAIEAVVEARSGGLFQMLLMNRQAIAGFVSNEVGRCARSVGLFPNAKSIEGIFDLSFQIVHDISFLLTSEFHHADTLAYHGLTILRDLASNARTFCVSHATASDLSAYLGVPAERITVSHPGAEPEPEIERYLRHLPPAEPMRPYIVVPGTIEPRKNIDLVLLGLQRVPQLLARYDWIFIGSPGWLIAFDDRIAQYGLTERYRSGAIKWLGYVDEYQKAFLYRHAELAIYPSFFEGFGIPVAEAMYFGCPVVCSYSSGIPEAGGNAAFYFDPTSILSFERMLLLALRQTRLDRKMVREASRLQALRLTWDDFARRIDETIRSTVAEITPQPADRSSDRLNPIVGFQEAFTEAQVKETPPVGGHFDLINQLDHLRREEVLRIGKIAAGLLPRFGPVVVVGFLYYELLGRPPNDVESSRQAYRLRQSPSATPAIIEELLGSADPHQDLVLPARAPGSSA